MLDLLNCKITTFNLFAQQKKADNFGYRLRLVRRMRLELTRPCDHYPLKVACIPISPPALVETRSDCLFCCASESCLSSRFLPLKIADTCVCYFVFFNTSIFVPKKGLEPSRLATYAPETYASTNSATWACGQKQVLLF